MEPLTSDYIKRVDKIWGRECWIVNNERYCAKILYINCNGCSSLHYHVVKDETFHILEGSCYLQTASLTQYKGIFTGMHEQLLQKGDTIRIKPRTPHRFYCIPEIPLGCKVLEISTTHSDEDVVRLEPSKCLA